MAKPEMVVHLKIDLSEELRAAVGAASQDEFEPWVIQTYAGLREVWIDDKDQESFVKPGSTPRGLRRLYVKKES